MLRPRLTPLAASLPATVPFVGPETQERRRGAAFAARLGANESRFGPSPHAMTAIAAAARDAWMYGDPEMHDLRAALAAHHGISMGNIMIGEGIDGLLGLAVRLLVAPAEAAVTSDGAYPTFAYHVAGFGGTLHRVAYAADHEDPDALLDRAQAVDARLIYLANPDNPMGSHHPWARIARLAADLPETTVLLLDEAYIELAPPGTAPVIDPETPNVLRFRTFSKGYGLAGLRVGYVIGPTDLIAAFERVRNHFGVGRIAQAGALAALADQAWLAQVVADVAEARARIGMIARAHDLIPLASATNFVTIDCGRDGDFARRVLAGLLAAGVFVRMPGVAPLDRCIRVGTGLPADLAVFAEALPRALAAARA